MQVPGKISAMYWRRRLARCRVEPWSSLPVSDVATRPSVAIVGNAGYLAQMRLGEQIDAHDIVVRMNDSQTTGFESAVGCKSDLLVVSFAREIRFESPQLRTPRWVASSVPPNFRKDPRRGLHFRNGINIARGLSLMQRDAVFVPSIEFYSELCGRLNATPSTGAMAILLITDVLAHCVGDVFITGFSFFEGRSHYYDDRNLDPVMHSMNAEKVMLVDHLRKLVDQGRVNVDPTMVRFFN